MKNPSSFRDPSGFVFQDENGTIFRQINESYKDNYETLIRSGLYQFLVEQKLIISHQEIRASTQEKGAYKIIEPYPIKFISYPYEWCFTQLKDAALATLRIQKIAIQYGMSLKDASAFNIQFDAGRPVLIDTLSFEIYDPNRPWVAYKQFCEHFLAPLFLASIEDLPFNRLMSIYLDGIPIDLASSLIPFIARFYSPALLHIYLHAKSQKRFSKRNISESTQRMTKNNLLGLIDNLESGVAKLKPKFRRSQWVNYYSDCNYSPEGISHKKQMVSVYIDKVMPKSVWDFGANNGIFSQIASQKGALTMAFDSDPCVVEENYHQCVKNSDQNLLPLVMDITNPSPALGWKSQERLSLIQRGPADMVLALALIHHLVLFCNLPFTEIASFFSEICRNLIIEFVPKSDSQVKEIFLSKPDIYVSYDEQTFHEVFSRYFVILDRVKITNSNRVLYLMQKK